MAFESHSALGLLRSTDCTLTFKCYHQWESFKQRVSPTWSSSLVQYDGCYDVNEMFVLFCADRRPLQ